MWPKVVRNYEISSLLGYGNYGHVRLAEHVVTKKRHAAKILPYECLEANFGITDIRREIAILMALSHPNIIHLHDVIIEDSDLILMMELATDGDLFNFINEHGALPEWRSREFFKQLVEAVLYCHKRGIYHRDLKPENILLTADAQEVKLADFGFAAMVDKHSSVHRLLHTNCGSPHYCAPEVWNGEQEGYYGDKADAFSCGVILYCMLFGVQPFYGSCEDLVLERVNKCEFDFPTEISPLARDLVEKLLTRDPEKRLCLNWAKKHPWVTAGPRSDGGSVTASVYRCPEPSRATANDSYGSWIATHDVSLASDCSRVDSDTCII